MSRRRLFPIRFAIRTDDQNNRTLEVRGDAGNIVNDVKTLLNAGSVDAAYVTAALASKADMTAVTAAVSAQQVVDNGTYGQGSDQWLKQCAGSFSFVFTNLTTTDATTGLPTSAAVRWPDGITGAFTGTIDAGGNGYSGYVVTYAGTTTKTVTASGITYDATTGIALGPTSLVVA